VNVINYIMTFGKTRRDACI